MSVIISIGESDERDLFKADESRIIQQIQARRKNDGNVCVQVLITLGDKKLRLATPGSSASYGRGPEPTPQQLDIINLWNKLGLNDQNFAVGQIIAFRAQLKKLI